MTDYIKLMTALLPLAKTAGKMGEIPVAAMVIDGAGRVIATDHNRVEQEKNALAHAEMQVLGQAMKKMGDKFLPDCSLIVTLEPCALCAAAIAAARIKTLVFGGYDEKSGGVLSGAKIFSHKNCHHVPEVIDGILRPDCEKLMQDFFLGLRPRTAMVATSDKKLD